MNKTTVYDFTIIPIKERYYNEDSCFGVYVFRTKDKLPYVKEFENGYSVSVLAGKVQRLTLGVEYRAQATAEYSKKYKEYNYIPQNVVLKCPETTEEQEVFLRSLITDRQASNILEVYPRIIDDVIQGREIDTKKIKGIGDKTWDRIKEKIGKNYVISEVLSILSPLGVSIATVNKLFTLEENSALLKRKLIENPYILTKVDGIGFKKADEIALKLNRNICVSNFRMTAFVSWYLNNKTHNEGDTWISRDTLDEAVKAQMPECYELYEQFIQEQVYDGKLLVIKGGKLGLKSIYNTEHKIINVLDQFNNANIDKPTKTDIGIRQAEKELGFFFTDEQKRIIKECCENSLTVISGQAGTGKSTILRGIINSYEGYEIACCALSAKAAQRIVEATGHNASTIHRLLDYSNGYFGHNADNPLSCDVLVLDEASMVNAEIFCSLLSAIKTGTKVIICGDDEQLPPIGCGNIFHDILRMNRYPCVKLTKILRQAEKSGIITDSLQIRQNRFPVSSSVTSCVRGELRDMKYLFMGNREKMRNYAIDIYLKTAEKFGIDNTIIITPCKKNRTNSTEEINKIIQDKLIPSSEKSIAYGKKEFRLGAKVIQRINDYEKNVFNGETGKVIKIGNNADGVFCAAIQFSTNKCIEYKREELASVELAYALTVHVTQGSGYDNVIILIDNSHYMLLDSCLLYTAITRAKKKCLLIAEPSAYIQCIKKKASLRKTWLSFSSKNN